MLSEAVELMARDVFPAEVLLPDGSMLLGVRVFCTTKRTLVFRAAGGQISLAAELEHSPSCNITRDRSSLQGGRLQVETPEGTAWVNQGSGCGCGSPLKALGTPVSW